MSDHGFSLLLDRVEKGESLDEDASARAFTAIMSGELANEEVAAFLTAQSLRGPTVPEIVGAARVMRANMKSIEAPKGAIDLCGTGGDGKGTLNISTAVSFVIAGCGVPVAKHGNRNMSSRTGAADVLEALGVRIDLEPEGAQRCLLDAGLCFLFAQTYHPAVRHVAQVRRQLGIRTIFNLLGPVANPARVKMQLLGVYSREWLEPLARVLRELGTERAWIVHGRDGLDEMTTTDTTDVVALENGRIEAFDIVPEDVGLQRATIAELQGGSAAENAAAIVSLLDGHLSPYRDIVTLNAAAALVVAGQASELREGVALAADSLDRGMARRALNSLVEVSNGVAR
jgi:anthranilate phosphoribosyltransferase